MSNDKNAKSTKIDPLASLPELAPPTRISEVRLVSKGAIISSPREAEDAVVARKGGAPRGYDIYFHRDRGEFRFDRYEDGKLLKRRWLDRTRIDNYEEWDPPVIEPDPAPATAA